MKVEVNIHELIAQKRKEEFEKNTQLSLGELIEKLEAIPLLHKTYDGRLEPKEVRFDFEYLAPTGICSWRGIYSEASLTFGESNGLNLEQLLGELKATINGKVFEGYKGGDYTFSKDTPVWVANYGNSGQTAVIDVYDNDYNVILHTQWMKDT